MIRVYIAMPYGDHNDLATRQYRTEQSMAVWHTLAAAGFAPCCPLLSHFLHEFRPKPREHWLAQSLSWVDVCDCVLAIGDPTEGMQAEIARALSQQKPVFRMFGTLGDAYGMEIQ